MLWLVIQELWKRYKIGISVAAFGLVLLVTLHLTGWIWTIDTWAKDQLHLKERMNPVVLFSLLIAIGMIVDDRRKQARD